MPGLRGVQSRIGRPIALGTALACAGIWSAPDHALAQQVQLTTKSGNATIEGELVGIEDGVITLSTVVGEVTFVLDDVICDGPGCPGTTEEDRTAGVPGASVLISSGSGNLQIEGTLIEFTGDLYRIDTAVGPLEIEARGATCEGPGCPVNTISASAVSVPSTPDTAVPPTPVPTAAPAPEPLQSASMVSVAPVDGVADVQLAGPASVMTGLLRALLSAAGSQDIDLVPTDLVDADQAAAAGAPNGRLVARANLAAAAVSVAGRLDPTSDISLRDVTADRIDAAFVATPAVGAPVTARTDTVLGSLAYMPLVALANPVNAISRADLAAVFTQEITDWADLGGSPGPIRVLGLPPHHDATVARAGFGLADDIAPVTDPAAVFADAQALALAVAADPTAIGFVPSTALVEGAKPLAHSLACGITVAPDAVAIRTGEYPYTQAISAISFPKTDTADAILSALDQQTAEVALAAGLEPRRIDRFSTDARAAQVRAALDELTDPTARLTQAAALRILPLADRLSTRLGFEPGGNRLTIGAQDELSRIIAWAEAAPVAELFVVGFANPSDDAARDRDVSARLAEVVRDALGVADQDGVLAETVVRTIGLGAVAPQACADAPGAAEINRRVEIWVRR